MRATAKCLWTSAANEAFLSSCQTGAASGAGDASPIMRGFGSCQHRVSRCPNPGAPIITSNRRKASAISAASPAKRDTPTRKTVPAKGTPRTKDPEPATTSATATKQDHCLQLLARRDGATLAELVAATDWQPHKE